MYFLAVLTSLLVSDMSLTPEGIRDATEAAEVAQTDTRFGPEVVDDPEYPVAYELISGRDKDAFPESTLMEFFDEETLWTMSARRDQTSIDMHNYDISQRCDGGNYCLFTWQFPGPLVLYNKPPSTFVYRQWSYSVVNADMSNATCNRYFATKSNDSEYFNYLHCGNGVVAIITGGVTKHVYELRSYRGLAASVTIDPRNRQSAH